MKTASQMNQAISMVDAVRGIARHKLLILTFLILGIASGLAVLNFVKPRFQAEAQIIIQNLATPYEKINSAQSETAADPVNERVVTSQISVIKSGDMQARVVEKLNLSDIPEFNPLLKSTSTLKALAIALGFSEDPHLLTPTQLALKQMDSRLTVYPTPDSNVVGIKYSSADPQRAADVANSLAEIYVASTRETGADSTQRAREWLQTQITDLRGKVSAAEAAVENYRSEAGLLKGENNTLGTQQISELNTQITLAETASTEAAARADEIRNLLAQRGTVDASSDVLNSPLIQNLREQQSGTERKISELSATYLPNHPKMVAARQELNTINRSLRVEAAKVVDSLIGQAKVAASRANSLRSNLEKLKASQSSANLNDVKLKELQRDADASRMLLEQMLSRYADANARQDTSQQPGFARVIQKAMPEPSNYFPKAGPILLLTTLAGMFLGLGLSFVLSLMAAVSGSGNGAQTDVEGAQSQSHPARVMLQTAAHIPPLNIGWPVQNATHEAEDGATIKPAAEKPVEKTLAVLAAIPSPAGLGATLAMVENTYGAQQSAITDSANRIASACLTLKDMNGLNTIALTTIGGKGMDSSLAIVAIARAMANTKKKIIAIDITPNSAFDSMFELVAGSGISDLIAGDADFTKVICRDQHSGAHIIRYGSKAAPHFQTQLAEKLGPILKALSGIYDVILLHAGEATATTPNMIKDCKGTLLLAPQIRYKDAVAAAKVLESKGMGQTMFVRLEQSTEEHSKHAASA
jgi:polysaccharide biosynthesis transport protein